MRLGKGGFKRFHEIYAEAADFPSKVTAWELDFLEDFYNNTIKFGEKTFVSDGQIEVLKKIAEKLGI